MWRLDVFPPNGLDRSLHAPILVGLLVVTFFTEAFGWTYAGLVVPGYLAAIASGPRHNNASVLLASVALRQMIERLSQISEVIVIDAPPVLAVNDALAVAPAANQILLVARVNSSDVGEVSDARHSMP